MTRNLLDHESDYSVHGTVGPWVILCHGLGMDRHMFASQVEALSSYRVVTWDAPGHGVTLGVHDVGIAAGARRLLALLDRLDIDAAHLVGQSMGGYVAQEVTRQVPERVLSFTSIGSTPFGENYYSGLDKLSLRWAGRLIQFYPWSWLVHQTARECAESEQARAYVVRTLGQHSKRGFSHLATSVYRELLDRRSPVGFGCPVLLTVGVSDGVGRVQQYTREWGARLGVGVQEIPGAAHNANMDNAPYFNEVLKVFLVNAATAHDA